jgi:hypothetical protein
MGLSFLMITKVNLLHVASKQLINIYGRNGRLAMISSTFPTGVNNTSCYGDA